MKPCGVDVDTEMVEALHRDDADGVEGLVERHVDRAYRLALRITGARQDAEQAVEDALLTGVGSIHTFTGESTFESWLLRRVASAAYQRLRQRAQDVNEITLADVMPPLDSDGRHFGPMDDWSNRIDEQALQAELQGLLSEALDALPADYRTALVLHDVEGAPKREIAAILGVDEPAVASRVHRARLFVRKRLSEYFESAEVA
jgi:RNA polymerase sigma-70 factor, ECF subfamily